MKQDPVFCIVIFHFQNWSPPSSFLYCCLQWTGEKQVAFLFELIDLHETMIMVASTVIPMPFMDIDSLDETRFCFCIESFHFQNCSPPSSYLDCCLNFSSSSNISSYASHDTSNKAPPTSHPTMLPQTKPLPRSLPLMMPPTKPLPHTRLKWCLQHCL